jgi:prevent-host-death family protein
MTMTSVSATKLRDELSEYVNLVRYQGERVILERRGRGVAALVSMEDLELIHALEDRIDLKAARKALKEKGAIPLETIKARLGVK